MTVYFIMDEGGAIKIGHSIGNPLARLNGLQTGNPRPLKLLVAIPGGREAEQELHQRFAGLRIRGEWFKPDPRLLGFIEGLLYVYAEEGQPGVRPSAEELYGLEHALVEAATHGIREVLDQLDMSLAEGLLVRTERDYLAPEPLATRLEAEMSEENQASEELN